MVVKAPATTPSNWGLSTHRGSVAPATTHRTRMETAEVRPPRDTNGRKADQAAVS